MLKSLAKFYLKNFKKIRLPRDLIEASVRKNANKIAVIEKDKKITYSELYERAKKLSNGLIGLNIKKGDKMAVMLKNCHELLEIRIASYLTGIVLVPIIWDMDIKSLMFILNDCEVRGLIYDRDILKKQINEIKENTRVKNFIEVSDSKESFFEKLIKENNSELTKPELSEDDLISINFSSGTTGRPKGVCLTNKCWIESFYNYVLNSDGLGKNPRVLHVLSFSTAGGVAFLPSFFIGSKNIILKDFNLKKIGELLLNKEIDYLLVSPGYLYEIIDYLKNKKIKSSLKEILVGTEIISKSKFLEAINFFGPIITGAYGMVEVLPPLTSNTQKDYYKNKVLIINRLKTVGRTMKGVEVKIMNKNKFGIGKIALKSGTISKGYWKNSLLTKKHFVNGWFITEDFGKIDKDNYIEILGRNTDIIKKSDVVYFRKEIEEIFHENKKVLEVCIIDNRGKTECYICPRTGSELTSKEIEEFYKKNISELIRLDRIFLIEGLPKNASGKVDINKLKEKSKNGRNMVVEFNND